MRKLESRHQTPFPDSNIIACPPGTDACRVLIGLHVFLGCDAVSVFSNKGKLGALELMQRKWHYQYNFSVFGQPWELSSGFFQKLQEFTCHLFVPKSATTDAIINFSLPKGMKLTPASFPHAKIAYSSMNCMQTIKREFGDDSCNVNSLCWIQQVMAGQLMPKGIWTFSGCLNHHHPKLSWSLWITDVQCPFLPNWWMLMH